MKARRSLCSSALPSRRGARTSPGSPAVRGGSPAATRYQPLHGPVRGRLRRQAYSFDHSCASFAWSGRRGGIASAVCLMAQPWTMVAWACGPRDRTTLPPQRRACWSVDTVVAVTPQAPVHVSRCCPHALGKTGHREGRMAAVQGTSASCLLGKQWAETGAGRARTSSAGAEPSCARAAP